MVQFTPFSGTFPQVRLSRLRRHAWLRDLVQEHHITVNDLIWSIIVRDPSLSPNIESMPDVRRYTIEELPKIIDQASELGIKALALFTAIPISQKCNEAKAILDEKGILNQAIQCIKKIHPHIGIFSDVALDPFTLHGQDCLIRDGQIQNDETLEVLARAAVLQAQCGADVIAPSEMMDGRISIIREALDKHHFQNVAIAAYSAKYASSFYGPYRDAVNTSKCLGGADKKTYQMNPANSLEAQREVTLDLLEGTDMIIIKPGISYIDIVARTRQITQIPIISFQVSGEYSMLKFAALHQALNFENTFMEQLISFKRAGANAIITYGACEAAKIIKESKSC